jgi:hypothetical protein
VPASRRFGAADLLPRLGFGVALVLATVNPTPYDFTGWAMRSDGASLAPVTLAGVALLIAWVIYVRATLRSIGLFGAMLAAAFLGALVWTLHDAGVLDLTSGSALQWVVLVGLGLVLGVGLSWSHVRRALSGQSDVDDVDE